MLSIKATKREKLGRKTKKLREEGFLPVVLYGESLKALPLKVSEKDFDRVFKQAGESTLIALEVADKKYEVLIHQIAKDPVTEKFIHVDFFHPSTKKKVEAEIPLVFEGEPLAVNDLGGVLAKELHSLPVKGLAHKLPREIKVNLDGLKSFDDRIFVKDLEVPEGIEILREADEIVAHVSEPKKVEEIEEVPKSEEDEAVEGQTTEDEGAKQGAETETTQEK